MEIKVESVKDFFILVAVLFWEHWLGRTKKTSAASTVDLAILTVKSLISTKEESMKPWDLELLLTKLKAQGLPLAEDIAENVVKAVFEWTEESIKASPTPYDDFALPLMQSAKAFILAEIDKIDGQVGVASTGPVS